MSASEGRQLSMLEAVREAMEQEMEADPRVVVLGEDIAGGGGLGPPYEGVMGGTFGATRGLLEKFGPMRVRDTPISEAGFVAAAVGAAVAGLRPIVDLMWSNFALLSFDQLANQAAKLRYMFGGQSGVPAVFRMAMGAGLSAGGQHSDTLYSLFTHVPGLKVVVPTNAYDAKGLLIQAIRDHDPVLVFEHMKLYPERCHVPEDNYCIPFGQARLARVGTDVTVVAVAAMVGKALAAAEQLAGEGLSVEVIDPRTLSPLDEETILTSVASTHHLLIVDESPPRCGIAADIAGLIAQRIPHQLRQGVKLLTCPHTPVPFSPTLESEYVPSTERIIAELQRLCSGDALNRVDARTGRPI